MDIYDNDGSTVNAPQLKPASLPAKDVTLKTAEVDGNDPELTVGYILAQMEKVNANIEYISKAIESIKAVNSSDTEDNVALSKVDSINNIVTLRETTNQKLLAMYEKMYDDIKPKNTNHAGLILLGAAGALAALGVGIAALKAKKRHEKKHDKTR